MKTNGDSSVDEASTTMNVHVRQESLSMFLHRRASNLQSVIQPYMDGTIGSLAIRQISPYIMVFFTDPSIYVHAHNINYLISLYIYIHIHIHIHIWCIATA